MLPHNCSQLIRGFPQHIILHMKHGHGDPGSGYHHQSRHAPAATGCYVTGAEAADHNVQCLLFWLECHYFLIKTDVC